MARFTCHLIFFLTCSFSHKLLFAETIHTESENLLQDDSVWSLIPAQRLEYNISQQVPANLTSMYRIFQTAIALYVEIRAYDQDLSQVRRSYGLRDHPLVSNEDRVSIIIDPQGSKKFAQVFGVNAACIPFDAFLDEVNLNLDDSLSFPFSVKCQEFEDSWRVRMRIPLSSFFYLEHNVNVNYVVDHRLIRESEILLASSPIKYFGACILCEAKSLGLVFPEQQFPLSAIVEASAFRIKLASEKPKDKSNLGLNLSIPIHQQHLLELAFQPDFAQIEIDQPILIANSRFPQFLKERRPFFQSGGEIFTTPIYIANQSRSIVAPIYGAKWLNRAINYKSYFLAAQDRKDIFRLKPGTYQSEWEKPLSPSQNLLTRIQYTPYSQLNLGFSANQKQENSLYLNQALGPDLIWQAESGHRLMSQFLWSSTDEKQNDLGPHSRQRDRAYGLGYQYLGDRLTTGWFYREVGSNFRNDLGFFPAQGFQEHELYAEFSTNWQLPEAKLQDIFLSAYVIDRKEERRNKRISLLSEFEIVYITDLWMQIGLLSSPRIGARADENSPYVAENTRALTLTLNPPRYINSFRCRYRWGDRLVYDKGELAHQEKLSCDAEMQLGLSLSLLAKWELDEYQQKSNLFHLKERLQSLNLKYFFTSDIFARIIYQLRDFENQTKQNSNSISYLIGRESVFGISAYFGWNSQHDIVDSSEYFAKFSHSI